MRNAQSNIDASELHKKRVVYNDLNALADQDDVLTITRRINDGTNGLDDRKAHLAKFRAWIDCHSYIKVINNVHSPRTAGNIWKTKRQLSTCQKIRFSANGFALSSGFKG